MVAVCRLVVRRRVTLIVASLAAFVAVTAPVARLLTTSSEVDGAVERAQVLAAELVATTGTPIGSAETYIEPRYLLAVQGPYDLVGVAMGMALLALLGGAVLTGGDWRSRAIGVLFARWLARALPATCQAIAWAAVAAAGALILLTATAGLLFALAGLRGSAFGADVVGTALLVLRGTLLAFTAGIIGAGAGIMVRSDVIVVIAVLTEVVVAELLMTALVPQWRSPGARLIAMLLSQDSSRESGFVCDVPRCEPSVLVGAGSLWLYAAAAAITLTITGGAALAASRSVWN